MLQEESERDQVWRASRKRLFRFPHVQAQDMHEVTFSDRVPQRFVREGVDAEAMGDPGDNVFVINLPRRPTKLRHALEQLHAAGVSATIVDGVDGDAFVCQKDMETLGVSTLPNYVGHANTLPFLTSGQLGCFMSHFAIWQHMVDNNIPSAVILEDDFDLQEDFSARLGQYLEEAHDHGEDWNLMYLGRSPTEGDWRVVSEHIVEPGYTLWTVGYILKLEVAKVFVESHVERQLAPLDHYFSVCMGKGLDLHWNEEAQEWAKYIPQVMRGLAVTPPLVMPWAGSMFLSDTAMMRKGTKYMKDLPVELPENPVWTPGIGMGKDAPEGL
jgi:collagen beta-1,O-galactosyltransferase